MSEHNKIALFDMDGTLCDFENAMLRDLQSLASPDDSPVRDFHNGEPHIEARMKMIKEQAGWWERLPPIFQNINVLLEAQRMGYEIHICTKGPRNTTTAWSEKKRWCDDWLKDVEHSVHITEDKGLIYGKMLMDDWPPYVERWLEWRPRGLVIMPTYGYNKDFKHPNVIHYDGTNLDEVVEAMRKRYED
jgi:hypothetical protein